jgi:hypothetical protein
VIVKALSGFDLKRTYYKMSGFLILIIGVSIDMDLLVL